MPDDLQSADASTASSCSSWSSSISIRSSQTIAKPGVTPAEAIENIDIGGPSLVRAAAKNHAFVTIATQPDQYAAILGELKRRAARRSHLRQKLAGAAFAHTAAYDAAIAAWFSGAVRRAEIRFRRTMQVLA